MASKKRRRDRKHFPPPGTPPGTLSVYPGVEALPAPKLRLIDYDAASFSDKSDVDVMTCAAALADPTVSWVHVQGRVKPEQLHALGERFHLHPLAMEDVLDSVQRPKSDVFDTEFFAVLALPRLHEATGEELPANRKAQRVSGHSVLSIEQVSIFLGKNYVVSFHEGEEDPFGPVRSRIAPEVSKFRQHGADYLFYALVDLVVDLGFPVLENLGDDIDDLEGSITTKPDSALLHRIHQLKRQLVLLRRHLWPQREVLGAVLRDDRGFFQPETRVYLRDCYDHSVQMMDLVETYREMASNLLDVYLSSVSNRLNEAMRFLTVISTIFIPLSFLVGVYGMNFERMPELKWAWGYPAVWVVIVVSAGSMLYFFKRRGWM